MPYSQGGYRTRNPWRVLRESLQNVGLYLHDSAERKREAARLAERDGAVSAAYPARARQ